MVQVVLPFDRPPRGVLTVSYLKANIVLQWLQILESAVTLMGSDEVVSGANAKIPSAEC